MKMEVNAGVQPKHIGQLQIEKTVITRENISEKAGEVRSQPSVERGKVR